MGWQRRERLYSQSCLEIHRPSLEVWTNCFGRICKSESSCVQPLPHHMFGEGCCPENTLFLFHLQQTYVKFSPPWVIRPIPLITRPASYTKSPLFFRPHLWISEMGREHHCLAWRPWASHSLSLDLSVPSVKWRVAVLPRVSPPTNPLLVLPHSPIRGTEDLAHSQQPVSSGVGGTPQLLTAEPAPSLQALKSPPAPTS